MKFSTRDLMLVTVIVAILMAWWTDHQRQAAENRELRLKRSWFGDATIQIEVKPVPNSTVPAPNPPKK